MPYLDIPERNGLRVHYLINPKVDDEGRVVEEDTGLDDSKETLCMLHSGGSTAELSFSAQFSDPRLTQKLNLISLDSRFHGKTTGGQLEYFDLEFSADDLIAAIDMLHLSKPFAVLGESYTGAAEATWLTIKRPDTVKGLFLAAPGFMTGPPVLAEAMLNDWLPAACTNKDGNGDGTGTVPPEQMRITHDYFFGATGRNEERRDLFVSEWAALRSTGVLSSHDLRHFIGTFARKRIPAPLMEQVKVPVMIIHAEHDLHTSPMVASEEWRDALPNAPGGVDIRVVAGAPHQVLYMDYSVSNRFLLGFLSKVFS